MKIPSPMTDWMRVDPFNRQVQVRFAAEGLTVLLKSGPEGGLKHVLARATGETVEEAMAHALNNLMAKQGEEK